MGYQEKLYGNLWWIVAALALVVVALWGNKYKNSLIEVKVIETAILQPACDLRQAPCTARFADGDSITLEIDPKYIPLLEPLKLIVTLRNNSYPETVKIDVQFEGTNMEMPFIRSTLHPLPPQAQDQKNIQKDQKVYSGKAILPVCTLQRMEWEARLSIQTPMGIKVAIFPFYTLKN
ncbi:MAG: hypothetical protein V3U84_09400 [Thiotrichaceae bacterium]